MRVTRGRELEEATEEEIWRVVRDPHHLPRWWPRAQRVEGVTGDAWTVVLGSDRGRSVRADYRLLPSRGHERKWALQVEGTPFERIFRSQMTTVKVDGTFVRLTVEQEGRRWARLGGVMLRRATGKMLDEALENLDEIFQ